MKTIIVLLFFVLASNVFSQYVSLEISYSRIENDKKKSTRLEKISVQGNSSSYSLEYTGETMPDEMNIAKSCELSTVSVNDVINSIKDNKVAVNESLYARERTNDEGIFYLIISVKMLYEGTPYEIILDGEANLVMENKVYLRVIEFIKDLRKILKSC